MEEIECKVSVCGGRAEVEEIECKVSVGGGQRWKRLSVRSV